MTDLTRAVETFISAYRARYMNATGHVRDSAPMREEVVRLNAALLRALQTSAPSADTGG